MSDVGLPKLLIVDDRPQNILALEKVLRPLPVNILSASCGNDALGQVLEHDFALVLMDVQMPDMDGFETAELMRSNDDTRHIPIIFVTAISKEERFVFKGYEAGAVDYLFKPIDPEILAGKVNIFLELHRRRSRLVKVCELFRLRHVVTHSVLAFQVDGQLVHVLFEIHVDRRPVADAVPVRRKDGRMYAETA